MTTELITSDQSKQFKRLVEDVCDRALREGRIDKGGLQRLIERGGEFQKYVLAGVSRCSSRLPDYTLARLILGESFISAEEIAAVSGFTYTEDQLVELNKRLPDQATLEWCRDNAMILMAGPPSAVSLFDLHSINSEFKLFYACGHHSWYEDESEKFARVDNIESGAWFAISKKPMEGSFSKNLLEQQALVIEPMTIPNVAEVAWMFLIYKIVRDVYLHDGIYVRTSSIAAEGDRVHVGDFDLDGLDIHCCRDDRRMSDLGISSFRKF